MNETLMQLRDQQEARDLAARYVRALDERNGGAVAALFLPEAKVKIQQRRDGQIEVLGELSGAEAIGDAVATMMAPHPQNGWSHHVTSDHLVTVDGDRAVLDMQFVMFRTQGAPVGSGQDGGTITPGEAGYYRGDLVRTADGWRIAQWNILHDFPYPVPGA